MIILPERGIVSSDLVRCGFLAPHKELLRYLESNVCKCYSGIAISSSPSSSKCLDKVDYVSPEQIREFIGRLNRLLREPSNSQLLYCLNTNLPGRINMLDAIYFEHLFYIKTKQFLNSLFRNAVLKFP